VLDKRVDYLPVWVAFYGSQIDLAIKIPLCRSAPYTTVLNPTTIPPQEGRSQFFSLYLPNMINARRLHRFLGVFFTPTILFFAFSGALQVFGLHESPRKGEPPPIAWIADIASIHKDQKLRSQAEPHEHQATPAGEAKGTPGDSHPAAVGQAARPAERQPSSQPLKLFVLAMAIALGLSSLIGVYLALSNPRVRGEAGIALALGVILPLLLLLL
jgi:hypothetical protein